jgi:hypothetical protein
MKDNVDSKKNREERTSLLPVPSSGCKSSVQPPVLFILSSSQTASKFWTESSTGGTRTHKPVRATVFETAAYASSATVPRLEVYLDAGTSVLPQV